MKHLTPLDVIAVPGPKADETYRTCLFGREYQFAGLRRLLAAADFSKAGDRGAGLAAESEIAREAAREILSSLTLRHLYDRPLADEQGRVDSVMRVNYDIDRERFDAIAAWTVGELKDRLLAATGDEAAATGKALTGPMAAAAAKLMDTHELVYSARKLSRATKARTILGLPGTLSSRLQPNHPSDDPRGVALLVYAGLAMGSGDALIGINPAIDTVDNVSALLSLLDKLRRQTGAPTQTCVLAHVKTQLACLERGAPLEIMFQSLAGTEATNLTEFDVSVDLLDRAYDTMGRRGALAGEARQWMYFETGQGSEYSYGKHQGTDMTTAEALTYGLARRYDPFMVNNVTGFIGPETHLDNFEMIAANLQDHFMGKLLGLPMGMAPCYTLHARITLEGQQMATQSLAAAGAHYYMDVCLNTDRMLAYFDTSAHDNQTLRELFGRRPAPDFLDWAVSRGIFVRDEHGDVARGANWGDPRMFCASQAEFDELCRATPALYGFDTAGPRPANAVTRRVRANQAAAREAVHRELDFEALRRMADFRVVETAARDKDEHLCDPRLGATLSAASASGMAAEDSDVQLVVTDGLSAEAVHANLGRLLPVLLDGLAGRDLKLGRPIIARYGRVKLAEALAERLRSALTIVLLGERPGGDAASATSLSAYLVFQLLDPAARAEAAQSSGNPLIRFEYSVISNIYAAGLPPVEAGSVIAERAWQILAARAAGNRLQARS
ncbi:MAG TPA: ethanolamine ammonia-lyase subunit EutB [Pirellulales bacterium]|nr:ethanolamine ammonia-lyase subunit EutB [Pirellulales bacterium]